MQPPASAAYFVVIVCAAFFPLFLLHSFARCRHSSSSICVPSSRLVLSAILFGVSLRSLLCSFSANVNQLLIVKIMNDLHGLPQSCRAASLLPLPLFLFLFLCVCVCSSAWGLSLAMRRPWGHLISTTCTIACSWQSEQELKFAA